METCKDRLYAQHGQGKDLGLALLRHTLWVSTRFMGRVCLSTNWGLNT